jgi:short subunit dehydrogenase-like uncharacterized protein
MRDAEFEIVLFGATSYVGRLVCAYLREHARDEPGRPLRWAIAGRSEPKLRAVRDAVGAASGELALLTADALDPPSLSAICRRAQVVLSTVGPYARLGTPLVEACVEAGADYGDLSGEVHWIRRMQTAFEQRARASGARIVHACGFDSIPSDLGVSFLQEHVHQRTGAYARRVKMRVERMRGGISGGTLASAMNVLEEAAGSPALRQELDDPYSICPPHPRPVSQPRIDGARYDPDFDAWVAPFVMAAVNTRVVLRSNALAGYPYGESFQYDEGLLTGTGAVGRLAALAITGATAGFAFAGSHAAARAAIARLLPKPGRGPSAAARERGYYRIAFLATTADGSSHRARVTGDRDPGYGSTARMFGQAGLSLARDVPRDMPGGFWTPATIFPRLLERLRRHAGMTFDLEASG